jgi:hypothetical protein
MAPKKPRRGRGSKRASTRRPRTTRDPARIAPRGKSPGDGRSARAANEEFETGTFGGEACPECGAPYEVRSGPRSYARREEGTYEDPVDRAPGPDERDPGLEDVERPSGASRRGNRGHESDEPRRAPSSRARRDEPDDAAADDENEGPSEQGGGFGPRGR